MPGVAALWAGQDWLDANGVEAVHQRETILAARLVDGLRGLDGVRLYCCQTLPNHLPTISLDIERLEAGEVGTMLDVDHDIATRQARARATAATVETGPIIGKGLGRDREQSQTSRHSGRGRTIDLEGQQDTNRRRGPTSITRAFRAKPMHPGTAGAQTAPIRSFSRIHTASRARAAPESRVVQSSAFHPITYSQREIAKPLPGLRHPRHPHAPPKLEQSGPAPVTNDTDLHPPQ